MGKSAHKPRKPRALPLAAITIDTGLQPRAGMNEEHIADLVEAIKRGDRLPPVVVFCDHTGKYWLASGFHRAEAFSRAGRKELRCEVRQGERSNALAFACGANCEHGLKRTNADKRRAVSLLIEAFPKWSNPLIAKAAAVSAEFVRQHRPIDETAREGADGKRYPSVRQSATVADRPHDIDSEPDRGLFDEPTAQQPPEPARAAPVAGAQARPAPVGDAKQQDADNAAKIKAQLFAEAKPLIEKFKQKVVEIVSRFPRDQVSRVADRYGVKIRSSEDGKPEVPVLVALASFLFDLEMGL